MQDQPSDLDERTLQHALRAWNITAATLAYAPLGFGDHHWTATSPTGRWFLTVADLSAKPHCGPTADTAWQGLHQAMTTAATLPLDFVAAPLRTTTGEPLLRLDSRYALSVFPFLDGDTGTFGDTLNPADRTEVLDLLARLHRTPPPAAIPAHHPELPSRGSLTDALANLRLPWTGGPFAEPARTLLAEHAGVLRQRLAEFDRLAAGPRGRPVVTHGEPHAGNLLRAKPSQDGARWRLLDWDTVALAVPERDLWLLAPDAADLARYAETTGHQPDLSALELYRLRWALADVAAFADWFRAPHARGADTEQAWAGLQATVSDLVARGD